MIKQFRKYLDETLPNGFYYQVSPDKKVVMIKNGGQYVYLFYVQEIEEDFKRCCSLVYTILDLSK